MKLNLGSGLKPLKDYVNVDKEPMAKPDVLFDLETFPWPWPDNSVEEIQMTHVLEHLGQKPSVFLHIIGAIYRILQPAGVLIVKVPHARSDGFIGDPTHVRAITPQLLSLFSKRHCQMCIDRGWANTPLAIYLNVDLELVHTNVELLPHWGEKLRNGIITEEELNYAMDTYNNVVNDLTMTLHKVE